MNTDQKHSSAPAVFATTHWSMILAAGREDAPKCSEALAQLCRTYWYPLYAYVRRKGHGPHDAEDLTQEFFTQLLARNYLRVADRNRGKFRSFLLGTLEHFLAREWTKAHAQKRGSGQIPLSLDACEAEDRYLLEPADELNAQQIYDRRWATTLLERAMTRLGAECLADHKADLFAKLKGLLSGERGEASYQEIGAALSMSEAAVKVAVHRLRQRYGELVRDEVAQTVATAEDLDEELRYLLTLLRE